MENIKLYKGELSGETKILDLPFNNAFELWAEHNLTYLKELYIMFLNSCKNKNIEFDTKINFLQFTTFIFNNSSKYLCPYL